MTTGYFGKIPATGDFVAWNLPRTFIDRWDRWMSMELQARPDEGSLNPRAWRFIVQAGVFGEQPCAGAWRMSQDRVGRRYPFAVIHLGHVPDAGDPWFDAVAISVKGAVEDGWTSERIAHEIGQLPAPTTQDTGDRIAFWCDDWEVHEFVFSDIHDLADRGLASMRAVRSATEAL